MVPIRSDGSAYFEAPALAEVRLPKLLASHMVLQQERPRVERLADLSGVVSRSEDPLVGDSDVPEDLCYSF